VTLESITCTHCGSSEVQEVKPHTYFCSHCEGVFKHIDPTQVTVTQEKAL
jgi:ribosomal protein L37AE/L43A